MSRRILNTSLYLENTLALFYFLQVKVFSEIEFINLQTYSINAYYKSGLHKGMSIFFAYAENNLCILWRSLEKTSWFVGCWSSGFNTSPLVLLSIANRTNNQVSSQQTRTFFSIDPPIKYLV